MFRESLESFLKFLAENKECRDKAQSFDGDVDALSAYAREMGFEFTAKEMLEYQDNVRELLKSKVLKFQPPDADKLPGERAFYELIKLAETDRAVAEELAAISADAPEELIAYGREKGFSFTERDMKSVGKGILDQDDELSDAELEAAAGGTLIGLVGLGVVLAVSAAVGAAVVGVGVAAAVGNTW